MTSSQNRKVPAAITSTKGTKMLEIRSAKCCTGALVAWARCTWRTIWASTESAPNRSADNVSTPDMLMVAPTTGMPGALSTGRLSPVTMLSSTDDLPVTTVPSTGIRSPGRTTIVSPTTTWSMGSWTSPCWRSTRAVWACKPNSFLMAAPVRPWARVSTMRPSRMRVMIVAEVSKYTCCPQRGWPLARASMTRMLKK